jgi:hypothetical protein
VTNKKNFSIELEQSPQPLTQNYRVLNQPLDGALLHATQTKLLLLRARRGTTHLKRRCFDRLIAATELIALSLENLRHSNSTPETFQVAEGATAFADASTFGVEVVQ